MSVYVSYTHSGRDKSIPVESILQYFIGNLECSDAIHITENIYSKYVSFLFFSTSTGVNSVVYLAISAPIEEWTKNIHIAYSRIAASYPKKNNIFQ